VATIAHINARDASALLIATRSHLDVLKLERALERVLECVERLQRLAVQQKAAEP
jgi:hypothetical protein